MILWRWALERCWCCGWPRIVRHYVAWPRLTTPARPAAERTAATPSGWQADADPTTERKF